MSRQMTVIIIFPSFYCYKQLLYCALVKLGLTHIIYTTNIDEVINEMRL